MVKFIVSPDERESKTNGERGRKDTVAANWNRIKISLIKFKKWRGGKYNYAQNHPGWRIQVSEKECSQLTDFNTYNSHASRIQT